jgi:hypothetical protein
LLCQANNCLRARVTRGSISQFKLQAHFLPFSSQRHFHLFFHHRLCPIAHDNHRKQDDSQFR